MRGRGGGGWGIVGLGPPAGSRPSPSPSPGGRLGGVAVHAAADLVRYNGVDQIGGRQCLVTFLLEFGGDVLDRGRPRVRVLLKHGQEGGAGGHVSLLAHAVAAPVKALTCQ